MTPRVNQPSPLPTNKLSASLLGMVLGAVVFEFLASYFPTLREIHIEGIGSLGIAFQVLFAGGLGYMIRDRANTQ